MESTSIIITVRNADEAEDIENVLREAEENGELDFAFNCQITERKVIVGDSPSPVHSTEYTRSAAAE